MIVVNNAGVIMSAPDVVKEFKIDDGNYVYLHFHKLENGNIVYGHGMAFDSSYNGSFSHACPDNEDQFLTMAGALAHAFEWACSKLSNSNHPSTMRLCEMIRMQDRQLDLFGEAV